MVKNLLLLLGLPHQATRSEVKKAYARQMSSLSEDNICCPCGSQNKVQAAREALSTSWEHMKKHDFVLLEYINSDDQIADPASPTDQQERVYCRPKLGQILVASGVLTLEQLDAVLEIQRNTGHDHIPLGQLLIASGYVNKEQLEYYLYIQQVLKLPSDHPQRWGQRLLDLGLISEDQLKIALIEHKTTGCTLRQALINRGWLTPQVLDRIF